MKAKIKQNIEKNAYARKLDTKHVTAYESDAGWIDYLVSEKIIFSHRQTKCSQIKHQYLHINNYFELLVYRQCTLEYIAENKTLIAEPKRQTLQRNLPNAIKIMICIIGRQISLRRKSNVKPSISPSSPFTIVLYSSGIFN